MSFVHKGIIYMPKLKTKKIVTKRVKITKGGKGNKILKKNVNTSHLNRKDDSSTRSRKKGRSLVSKSEVTKVKKLLGK